jgi:hypothetical protein
MTDVRCPRALIVLCGYLLAWVPLNFVALASQSLPSLADRGPWAFAEIGVGTVAAALCAGAGWMLWSRNPGGRPLALIALVVNLGVSIQGLFVSALPRNVSPGLAPVLTLLATAHALAWMLYLNRSRALGEWLDGD